MKKGRNKHKMVLQEQYQIKLKPNRQMRRLHKKLWHNNNMSKNNNKSNHMT